MINDNNYYQISGWMINRLELKGYELQAYAIIYGFTQDGHNWYTGSLAYLSDWLNCSRRTCITVLASLVDKELLIKKTRIENGQTLNKYQVNLKKLEFEAPKRVQAEEVDLFGNAVTPKKGTKAAPKAKKSDIFEEYAEKSPALLEKLREFEESRIVMKARMSDAAKKLLISKLEKDFKTTSARIDALNEAILNGWKSVYPRNGTNKRTTPKKYDYSNSGTEGIDYL